MKQNYYFGRILSALILLMASSLSWAYDFEAENEDGVTIYYNLINGGTEAEVTYVAQWSASYFDEVIKIPDTVVYDGNTYRVTSIGDAAFYYCSGLTSVTIPESVTSIGIGAFNYCRSLTSITIPNSVTSIGLQAFSGCNGLTSIDIPNSVTSIGDNAFDHCWSLTSITIPNSVTSIGNGLFEGCDGSITSIVVDNGNPIYDSRNDCNAIIETATNTLIQGCNNTVIPNDVTCIGARAFRDCTFTSITIPNSVTRIEDFSFYNCYRLSSVTIPSSVTNIGIGAFGGCVMLDLIVVDSDNPIYDSRDNCNAIIETASNTLIQGCNNTIIPNGVTKIGERAFDNCRILTSINIPEGVTSIEGNAFNYCNSLTSIDIPSSVTSIGDAAFSSCYDLTCIISHIEEPFIIYEGVFGWSDRPYSSSIFYCPNPEAYRETAGWSKFTDIRPLEGEEEVTLAIGDAHYATFMAPFEVTIPENVKAYTVSEIKEDGETLQMDELMGTIPANTPVVLYCEETIDEPISGMRTTQVGTSCTYGLLTGVYKDRQAPADSYVLQSQDDEVAFYYVAWWNGYPTVTANHAYLTIPNAYGVKALRFGNDDETTSIQATVSDQESKAVIYDMTGRRVEKATKGMYIIDGKKVMVK